MAEKHIKVYPNGATLIYYRQNLNSTTDVTMGFVSGARRDGTKKGLAHALEHSLFNGIDGMTKDEMYHFFKNIGNQQNAYTSNDVIATTFNCPNANVEKVIKINGDMWAKNSYSLQEWKRERKVILQELYMVLDEDTDYTHRLSEKQQKDAILGSPVTLAKITPQDFIDYKQKNFVTNNMVISVVSSLPYEQIKGYFEKYFINRFPTDARKKLNVPKHTIKFDNKLQAEDRPYSNSFLIQLVFKSLDSVEKDDLFSRFEDWYFNNFGLLYEKFVLKEPLVYTPEFFRRRIFSNSIKGFSILTSPANANRCVEVLCETINNLIENGVSDNDVALFKRAMLAERERKTDIKCYPSNKLFNDYLYGRKPFVKGFFNKLMALSKDDINKYIQKVYGKSKFTLVYSGDIQEAQGKPDVQNYPINVISDLGLLTDLAKIRPLYSAEQVNLKMRYAKWLKLEKEFQKLKQNSPQILICDQNIYELLNQNQTQDIYSLDNPQTKKEVKKQIKQLLECKNQ